MKARLRTWLFMAGALVALMGVVGALVLLSGIVPLTASSGHWGITRWVLELGKRRSVATHSLGIDPPELDAAQLVFRGAGHYETGCRPCHGSPGIEQPRVARAMLPAPPDLSTRVKSWETPELFHIVKHGIKLTGMPAWPSQQRDDEVWAVIAFLLELPELDGAEYRALVYGDAALEPTEAALLQRLEPAEEPPLISTSCVRCHGVEGKGRTPSAVPKLSGQRLEYFVATLEALAAGERHSGIMGPVAANLSREQVRALARYYASVSDSDAATRPPRDPAAFERGEQIARLGIPGQGVPSCRDCHGPGPEERNPMYPALPGQYAEYLVLQLELFKAEQRGGSSYVHLMRHVATRLSREQMRDVAAYYAGLPMMMSRPGAR
jgi:cytochrome c553